MTETIKLMKAHTSVRRFKEQEIPQADLEEILDYDKVQADYAGARATTSWSQRLAEQFGQAEPRSTRKNLEQKKLL